MNINFGNINIKDHPLLLDKEDVSNIPSIKFTNSEPVQKESSQDFSYSSCKPHLLPVLFLSAIFALSLTSLFYLLLLLLLKPDIEIKSGMLRIFFKSFNHRFSMFYYLLNHSFLSSRRYCFSVNIFQRTLSRPYHEALLCIFS